MFDLAFFSRSSRNAFKTTPPPSPIYASPSFSHSDVQISLIHHTLLFPCIDHAHLITLFEIRPHGETRRSLVNGLWCGGSVLAFRYLFWRLVL